MKIEEHLGNIFDTIKLYKRWYREAYQRYLEDPEFHYPPERRIYLNWIRRVKSKHVGKIEVYDVGAPGIGNISYKITKVNSLGDYYGICIRDTVRILDPSECV